MMMRLFDMLLVRRLRVERQMPSQLLLTLTVVGLFVVISCVFVSDSPGLVGSVASIIVGAAAGVAVGAPLSYRLSFRRGWWAGRQHLRQQVELARRDGFDVMERLRAEELLDMHRLMDADLPLDEDWPRHHDP